MRRYLQQNVFHFLKRTPNIILGLDSLIAGFLTVDEDDDARAAWQYLLAWYWNPPPDDDQLGWSYFTKSCSICKIDIDGVLFRCKECMGQRLNFCENCYQSLPEHATLGQGNTPCAKDHNFVRLSSAGICGMKSSQHSRGYVVAVGIAYKPVVDGLPPFDEWLLKIRKKFEIDKTLKFERAARKIQMAFRLYRELRKVNENL